MIDAQIDWPRAWGGVSGSGLIKSTVDDFQVIEELSFEPAGEGEHVFLYLEKQGENTDYVARLLARFAGVRQRDIGYAGLKDRHARTRQWFSIWLPGKPELEWRDIETQQIKVLQVSRHLRKLKRGAIRCNHFQINLRDWQGENSRLQQQLQQIKTAGFPNYFAQQRFGRDGQNLNKALAMFNGQRVKRQHRSLYLSAARSWLFNQILAERVRQGNWNQLIGGDICQLDNSHSLFEYDESDKTLPERCQAGDIHPTAVLFGQTTSDLPEISQRILQQYPEITAGLSTFGLTADYRALRVIPQNLHWQQIGTSQWRFVFSLPAGAYATALMRELITTEPP
ncbi:tRNA pseudouridine(13) synthase TruD [methane-oxidizing endosymbiont of Gigantopelta aegis]|uniref:tRNA pseudouridine(13) synthase TruD n=1 Tax=methane-oxidizing endosymbiont of Gigantopelta aegis TaxID=2794938 RepID=UPI0018DDBC42|nr:tRNA pseudouridine(13) synthase TruD [methane-oxidizing endosymbiont of Gigantopelta aegis]